MPFVQILRTAASIAAVGGGSWGVDRVMGGLCRLPAAEQDVRGGEGEEPEAGRHTDTRLHY